MDFPSLLAGIAMKGDLLRAVDALLALKMNSLEMGERPHIPLIDEFIEHEMAEAERPGGPPAIDPGFREKAEQLFQGIVLGRGQG